MAAQHEQKGFLLHAPARTALDLREVMQGLKCCKLQIDCNIKINITFHFYTRRVLTILITITVQ
jgi:hypothetical protein